MLTLEQAKVAMDEACAEFELVRKADVYSPKAVAQAFDAQRDAREVYHVLAVNATVDAAEEAGESLLCRSELCAKLDAEIRSKLSFGDAILLALERQQYDGGEWSAPLTRWDFRARAADGSHRTMSQEAFIRGMGVLFGYTLRRADTGGLCPPYRLRATSLGLVPDVDASVGAIDTDYGITYTGAE